MATAKKIKRARAKVPEPQLDPELEPPRRTCRDALTYLRQFMRDETIASDERMHLWAVLTALRGPDFRRSEAPNLDVPGVIPGDWQQKRATTAVVRAVVFGLDTMLFGADKYADDQYSAQVRAAMVREKDHFYYHATEAFKALGLSWEGVNLPEGRP